MVCFEGSCNTGSVKNPAIATVVTVSKCCHWLIGTQSLRLCVGALVLAALRTPDQVTLGTSSPVHLSHLSVSNGLFRQSLTKLLHGITCHFFSWHVCYLCWRDLSRYDTLSESEVLSVTQIGHSTPHPLLVLAACVSQTPKHTFFNLRAQVVKLVFFFSSYLFTVLLESRDKELPTPVSDVSASGGSALVPTDACREVEGDTSGRFPIWVRVWRRCQPIRKPGIGRATRQVCRKGSTGVCRRWGKTRSGRRSGARRGGGKGRGDGGRCIREYNWSYNWSYDWS